MNNITINLNKLVADNVLNQIILTKFTGTVWYKNRDGYPKKEAVLWNINEWSKG